MSERKVLNKYYPPDFDPSKIPRMKMPKNRQYTVRLMAPFNMRCVTCGEYIYKGKKFNARKEDVEGEDYLGIRIYRFYIKCTRCLQEISFKTDPRNTDYEIEAGATRNFMALKLAEEQAQREEDERKEDEATNPMKLLENRTKQSKQELELLESLEELRDLNRRQRSVDFDGMLSQFDDTELRKRLAEQQEEEDEKFIKSVFGKKKVITEEIVETSDSTSTKNLEGSEPPTKMARTVEPMQSMTAQSVAAHIKPSSVGSLNAKKPLTGLVRLKNSSGSGPVTNSESEEAMVMGSVKTAVAHIKPTSVGSLSAKKPLTGLVRLKNSTGSGPVTNSESVEAKEMGSVKTVTAPIKPSSVGSLNGKKAFSGLVRLKNSAGSGSLINSESKPSTEIDIKAPQSNQQPLASVNKSETKTSTSNGLSLLGSYSGSDSDSS